MLAACAALTACGHFGVDIAFNADDLDGGSNVDGATRDDASISADGASDASADARDAGPPMCEGPSCPVVYVAGAPVGNDTNPGTADKPVATIQKGIDLAKSLGFSAVHVAAKASGAKYPEAFTVVEGVSLVGAFDCKLQPCSWKRDLNDQTLATVIAGTDYRGVVLGDELTRATRIDGFTIHGKGSTPDIAPGAVALTIEGAPTVRNCRIESSGLTGGTEDLKRSIAVAIFGPATKDPSGPLLEKNVIRAQQGLDASVGIWIDVRGNAVITATASATIEDNNIRSATGTTSIGIFARKTSAGTVIEANAIASGSASGNELASWAIYSDRGAMKVERNRLNVDANATGTSGPSCTQNAFCGGFRGDNSSAQVKSNIIRGARAPFAAGVLMHGVEGQAGELIVNGNTIDPVGIVVPDGATVSAAIVVSTVRTVDTTSGRVRNNILLGGQNAKRYGVYEQKLSAKAIHLQAVSNNVFWNVPRSEVAGDFAYRTWDGANEADFTFAELTQVTTPVPADNVGVDPKLDSTFHLTTGSTAVFDKGTLTEAPAHDFDGEGRPKGQGIDLGADEKQ